MLWSDLLPAIIGAAIVPVQIAVTLLLLQSDKGIQKAAMWVAGMGTVRLGQGAVFGLMKDNESSTASSGPGVFGGVVLTLMGLIFLTEAAKQVINEPTGDDPPGWLAKLDGLSMKKAFVYGAGLMLVAAKFWVLTLSAIHDITEADLNLGRGILTFVGFTIATLAVHLALIAYRVIAPGPAKKGLGAMSDWITAHNRILSIGIGAVFGLVFLSKGIDGLVSL